MPVRSTAWLSGDLGRTLEAALQRTLHRNDATITRLPRGFLVEAPEAVGVLLELVHRATLALEGEVSNAFPVMHHDMGPVWTGTLQAVFDPPVLAPLPVVIQDAEPIAA